MTSNCAYIKIPFQIIGMFDFWRNSVILLCLVLVEKNLQSSELQDSHSNSQLLVLNDALALNVSTIDRKPTFSHVLGLEGPSKIDQFLLQFIYTILGTSYNIPEWPRGLERLSIKVNFLVSFEVRVQTEQMRTFFWTFFGLFWTFFGLFLL